MIDVKDLRIGNALQHPSGRLVFVSEIHKTGFWYVEHDGHPCGWHAFGDDYLKAAPLTEEWLVRMGFVTLQGDPKYNRLYRSPYDKDEIEVTIEPDGASRISINCGEGWVPNKICYVHQLQNLYFALTGEELTIGQQKTAST